MLLNADEMAVRLRITPQTVRRLARQHRLPGTLKVGGQLRWPSEAIDSWLASGCVCGAAKNEPRYVDDNEVKP